MTSPEKQARCFEFLDRWRASGMHGLASAPSNLRRAFNLEDQESVEIVAAWIRDRFGGKEKP
jgi:hypothetical protein